MRKPRHELYGIWSMMKSRCNCKTNRDYKNYGARGVKVCTRWDNFDTFVYDMGPRPPGRQSLDRIDNEGNYEPGNCRWTDMTTQANNRRNNVRLMHEGRSWGLKELSDFLRIPISTLQSRRKSDKRFDAPLLVKKVHSNVFNKRTQKYEGRTAVRLGRKYIGSYKTRAEADAAVEKYVIDNNILQTN